MNTCTSTCAANRSPAITITAVRAVMGRQLGSLLGNPLGYVFILAFVLACGTSLFLFNADKYFARNIADLAPLYAAMPFFLMVLLPALAMGAWASERDLGTEEHLLTLPLSVLDAVLGKFLAVAAYFTLALVCSLANVGVLMWLGQPDYGLVAANYIGWWLAGLVLASASILASALVSLPAIAFVIGALFSGLVVWVAGRADWFDAFNRGVVQLGSVGAALALIIGFLGLAVFQLSARRWRPGGGGLVVAHILSLVFGLVLLGNLARVAHRGGVDLDTTQEGLSSISATSAGILTALPGQVVITAFISKDLPADLELKAKELETRLNAIARASSAVKVQIHRPADALDKAGEMATKEFGLRPRKVIADTVTGREFNEVFLGAAVANGSRTQVIEHFDPGLSVEYELVRAIRSVSVEQKKVLGVATTDLEINGSGFDYMSGQMSKSWEVVEEWKKQYEVRPVNLDAPVPAEIAVLVVPQPSTLTQPQIEQLHDYIWAGRPTFILEDPLPYFSVAQGRQDLIPSQPKKSAGQQPGQPPAEDGPRKGDIRPLWKALGLDFDEGAVAWSSFNPSAAFRGLIPPNFVWTNRTLKGVQDGAATTGVNSLLLPFPGAMTVATDKAAGLTVTPLVTAVPGVTWGKDMTAELADRDFMGRFAMKEPKRRYIANTATPALMVEITGIMPSAWPRAAAEAKAEEGKEIEKKVGLPSAKPVHVIVISDIDCINDEFFQFYRNTGNRFKEDEMKFLLELRNVQLAANAVDALFNDTEFLALRSRRAERRPLAALEAQLAKTESKVRENIQSAESDAQFAIDKANADLQSAVAKIDERDDLDDNAKAHEKQKVQMRESRKVELQINELNQDKERKIRDARIEQRRAVTQARSTVQTLAIAVPALLLVLLIIVVFINRMAAERAHVPAARKRS
jgi:ABC-2 type transport system permease protein